MISQTITNAIAVIDAISTAWTRLHGALPWLVYVEWTIVGLYAWGEFLRGAYPAEKGDPPRWAAGFIRLSRGPRLLFRTIGRFIAMRSKRFGFDFSDEASNDGTKVLNLPDPNERKP